MMTFELAVVLPTTEIAMVAVMAVVAVVLPTMEIVMGAPKTVEMGNVAGRNQEHVMAQPLRIKLIKNNGEEIVIEEDCLQRKQGHCPRNQDLMLAEPLMIK